MLPRHQGARVRDPYPFNVEFSPDFHSRQLQLPEDIDLLQRAYALRYSVYCEERGFLPRQLYPHRRESDAFDARSVHFCTFNRDGELVGYARLVGSPEASRFPFLAQGMPLLDGVVLPPPQFAAEISRLMVRADYRRRRGDTLAGAAAELGDDATAQGDGEHRRVGSPQILLSLYRAMYAHSVDADLRYWYAAMERPLARALVQMNFRFRPVSPETDYFGPVTAYMADLRELEVLLDERNPALMAWLHAGPAAAAPHVI